MVDSDSVMTEVGSPPMGIGALSGSGVCVKVIADLEALNLVDNLYAKPRKYLCIQCKGYLSFMSVLG